MEDKKMKVLMTTDTVGGVWVYSLELCKALAQYDVQVHLVALGGWPSPAQQVQAEKIPNVTFYKSDFKLEWMKDPWEDVERSRKWINCIYQTVKPDVVHFNNYAHVEEEWAAPALTVFHSCVQTWWQAVKGIKAPHEWDHYSEIVQESLQASDIVIAPTKAILARAQDAHSFTSETKVIPNGRRLPSEATAPKEEFILCMGRMWDEAKNLPLLSKNSRTFAMAGVRRRGCHQSRYRQKVQSRKCQIPGQIKSRRGAGLDAARQHFC